MTRRLRFAPHLDDVAAGVLGVCADKHGEERGDAVISGDGEQRLLEVLLIPGSSDVPATKLQGEEISMRSLHSGAPRPRGQTYLLHQLLQRLRPERLDLGLVQTGLVISLRLVLGDAAQVHGRVL